MAASPPFRSWSAPSAHRDGSKHGSPDRADQPDSGELRRRVLDLDDKLRAETASPAEMDALLAQERKLQALGQVAAGVIHDFNHVLQVVRSGIALLEREAPPHPERIERITRSMASAVEHGGSLTRRLLSFLQNSAPEPGAVDMPALLQSVREMLACTLEEGITVSIKVEDGLPRALADERELRTVLLNLIANARDAILATPSGAGRVTLEAAPTPLEPSEAPARGLPPGFYVRLSVVDTGAGMDSATLARAAEPFFTTKPAGRGTGLGLAMARDFVTRSGGALAVSSGVGQGTTVSLWLPQAST